MPQKSTTSNHPLTKSQTKISSFFKSKTAANKVSHQANKRTIIPIKQPEILKIIDDEIVFNTPPKKCTQEGVPNSQDCFPPTPDIKMINSKKSYVNKIKRTEEKNYAKDLKLNCTNVNNKLNYHSAFNTISMKRRTPLENDLIPQFKKSFSCSEPLDSKRNSSISHLCDRSPSENMLNGLTKGCEKLDEVLLKGSDHDQFIEDFSQDIDLKLKNGRIIHNDILSQTIFSPTPEVEYRTQEMLIDTCTSPSKSTVVTTEDEQEIHAILNEEFDCSNLSFEFESMKCKTPSYDDEKGQPYESNSLKEKKDPEDLFSDSLLEELEGTFVADDGVAPISK